MWSISTRRFTSLVYIHPHPSRSLLWSVTAPCSRTVVTTSRSSAPISIRVVDQRRKVGFAARPKYSSTASAINCHNSVNFCVWIKYLTTECDLTPCEIALFKLRIDSLILCRYFVTCIESSFHSFQKTVKSLTHESAEWSMDPLDLSPTCILTHWQ